MTDVFREVGRMQNKLQGLPECPGADRMLYCHGSAG